METTKLPIIGLTGGMGSGKSVVSQILAARGGCILDADVMNHEQMRKGMPAYAEIAAVFGEGILGADGEIVRRRLGDIVFRDAAQLQTLVEITHRHILAAMTQAIEALRADNQGYRFIVIDAPLLIEANIHKICDAVWVVTADEETKIARVLARDGLTRPQVLERIRKQIPQDVLAGYADSVLPNDGGLEALEEAVDACLGRVIGECT